MTGKQPAAASAGMDDQASPRSRQVRADGGFVFRHQRRYVFVQMTSQTLLGGPGLTRYRQRPSAPRHLLPALGAPRPPSSTPAPSSASAAILTASSRSRGRPARRYRASTPASSCAPVAPRSLMWAPVTAHCSTASGFRAPPHCASATASNWATPAPRSRSVSSTSPLSRSGEPCERYRCCGSAPGRPSPSWSSLSSYSGRASRRERRRRVGNLRGLRTAIPRRRGVPPFLPTNTYQRKAASPP
jgi:hypothetical protein